MAVETILTALLTSVCENTFTDFAPVDTPRPYITYQQIGGEPFSFIDRTVPGKENALVQINVWSDTRAEAIDLIKQIEVLMIECTDFQAQPASTRHGDFDADVPVYGSTQDWSIWCDR